MKEFSRTVRIPFQEAVDRIIENLRIQGFGVITSIDLKDVFKQKLNIGFRNYKILGVCNPSFAYKAVSLDSSIGNMLPCNVVIQEHENGEVEITAVNPLNSLGSSLHISNLADLATEVGHRLRIALDNTDRAVSTALFEEVEY